MSEGAVACVCMCVYEREHVCLYVCGVCDVNMFIVVYRKESKNAENRKHLN